MGAAGQSIGVFSLLGAESTLTLAPPSGKKKLCRMQGFPFAKRWTN